MVVPYGLGLHDPGLRGFRCVWAVGRPLSPVECCVEGFPRGAFAACEGGGLEESLPASWGVFRVYLRGVGLRSGHVVHEYRVVAAAPSACMLYRSSCRRWVTRTLGAVSSYTCVVCGRWRVMVEAGPVYDEPSSPSSPHSYKNNVRTFLLF